MADPFGVWYDTYIEEDYEWYVSLTREQRKDIDAVAEDAWQAGYETGCQYVDGLHEQHK